MKKHFKLLSLLLVLAIVSCNTEELTLAPADQGEQEVTTIIEEAKYEQGFVRIKVGEELSTRMEQATRSAGSATRGMNADDVLNKVKVREMTRTFPYAGRFEERTRKEGLHLWYDVTFDTDIPLATIQAELKSIGGVADVELRPIVQNYGNGRIIKHVEELASSYSQPTQNSSMPFNDTYLSDQWHYQNDGSRGNKYIEGADINLFDAWEKETGSPNVIVAIVDGGVQYNHVDLAANMWINTAELDGVDGQDDDNNGYIDDIYGFNFVTNKGQIIPEDHGTHVAGTVAAVNNNGRGVAGVAGGDGSSNSGVRIMSCQIFVPDNDPSAGNNGRGGTTAIKYGADNGAVISQNSWGYEEINYVPQSDKEAIDYFIKYAGIDENGVQVGPMKGGVVIFAAANEDRNYGSPAAYAPVLSVSAIAADYKKAYYSNFGSWVSVAAPGGDYYSFGNEGLILSTVTDNKYAFMQGTSMACPHVSGIAALLVSNKQGEGLVPSDIKDAIINTGHNINEYNPKYTNQLGKLVDTSLALEAMGKIAPDKVENLTGTALSNTVNLSWTVPADEDNIKPLGFDVFLSKQSLDGLNPAKPGSDIIVASFDLGDKNVGDQFSAVVDQLEFSTKYYIGVSAYDIGRNYSELSDVITLTTGVNNPPKITTSDKTSFTLKSHEAHTINLVGSDKDNHDITWSMSKEIQGVTFSQQEDNKAMIFVSALAMEAGNYEFVLSLTDEYMAKDEVTVKFTILANNPPKSIKAIDNMVLIGIDQEQTYNLSEYFVDEDGEELDYQLSSSDTRVAALVIENGVLKLGTLGYGMADMKITARDARGEMAVQEFKVLVKANDSPLDLYPNPMKDKLWVRTNKDAQCEVVIHNSAGAEVHNETIASSPFAPHAIDVSSYAGGLYQVTVKIDGVEHKKQIIKQ